MSVAGGVAIGVVAWFLFRYILTSFYTVQQDELAVKTRFGRAERIGKLTSLDDPVSDMMAKKDRERYIWPQLRIIQPGGPYFKWPWERIHKVKTAINTINMALDLENREANHGGTMLDAVTKDQLNIGLRGQVRYRVSERNVYAYLFGVKNPVVHVMGYFIAILRERIASFETPDTEDPDAIEFGGISINDLRKNLSDLNDHMERECASSAARYGVVLDASLITEIDPPADVESALAAINTAHNQVSAEISVARAEADQQIVMSKRAVEIETLKAHAEVEPLRMMADQLAELKASGPDVLDAYLRNVRLRLFQQARRVYVEVKQ